MGATGSIASEPIVHVHFCAPVEELQVTCTEYYYDWQKTSNLPIQFTFTESKHDHTHDEIKHLIQKSHVFVLTITESSSMSYIQSLEYEIATELFRPIIFYVESSMLTDEKVTKAEFQWLKRIKSEDTLIKGKTELQNYLTTHFKSSLV